MGNVAHRHNVFLEEAAADPDCPCDIVATSSFAEENDRGTHDAEAADVDAIDMACEVFRLPFQDGSIATACSRLTVNVPSLSARTRVE